MPATIMDMGDPKTPLPEFLVVDSSLLLELLAGSATTPRQRAAALFLNRVSQEATKGALLLLVPLLVMEECLYKIIQWKYEALFGLGFANWHQAGYKKNPQLIQGFGPELQTFRQSILNLPATITGPEELILTPIFTQTLEQHMLSNIQRYNLLPKDAYIISEAERLGVNYLATTDRDWDRADGFVVFRPK